MKIHLPSIKVHLIRMCQLITCFTFIFYSACGQGTDSTKSVSNTDSNSKTSNSGSKKIGTQPFEIIEIDLAKGILPDRYVPFDVPFILKGKLNQDKYNRVSIYYAEQKDVDEFKRKNPNKNCDCLNANGKENDLMKTKCVALKTWNSNEITREADSFYIQVPALEPNKQYRFYCIIERKLQPEDRKKVSDIIKAEIYKVIELKVDKIKGQIKVVKGVNNQNTIINSLLSLFKENLSIQSEITTVVKDYLTQVLGTNITNIEILEPSKKSEFEKIVQNLAISDQFFWREYYISNQFNLTNFELHLKDHTGSKALSSYDSILNNQNYQSLLYSLSKSKDTIKNLGVGYTLLNTLKGERRRKQLVYVLAGMRDYKNSTQMLKGIGTVKRNPQDVDPYINNLKEYNRYLLDISNFLYNDLLEPSNLQVRQRILFEHYLPNYQKAKKELIKLIEAKNKKEEQKQKLQENAAQDQATKIDELSKEIDNLQLKIDEINASIQTIDSKFRSDLQELVALIDIYTENISFVLEEIESYKSYLHEMESKITALTDTILKSFQVSFNADLNTLSSAEFITRTEWYVSADLGVAHIFYNRDFSNDIQPYLGVNFNFFPINRQRPYSLVSTISSGDWKRFLKNFSGVVGVSTNTFNTNDSRRNDLWNNMNLLTGIGLRISDPVRVSYGLVWIRKNNENPLINKLQLKPYSFISLSFDLDVKEYLRGLGDKLFPN